MMISQIIQELSREQTDYWKYTIFATLSLDKDLMLITDIHELNS